MPDGSAVVVVVPEVDVWAILRLEFCQMAWCPSQVAEGDSHRL